MIPEILAAVVALVTPSPTPTPSPPPVIGNVRVATGSLESLHRLPFAASLLRTQQIRAIPAMTSDELLRALPGFDRSRSNSAFTNYGQLRVSFGGAGNDRGLVLIDGVPAQDAFGGQVDWAAYPVSDIARAELLRGPGSALYGSGAIGGVLSISTFGPTTNTTGPALGSAQFSAGSHSLIENDLETTAAVSPRVAISISGAQQRLSYEDLPPGYRTPLDSPAVSSQSMTALRLRYSAEPNTTLEYGYRGAWDYQQEGRPNYDFWRNFIQNTLTVAHAWHRSSLNVVTYQRHNFVTNRADKSSAPGMLLYTQYVPTDESGAIATYARENGASTFEARADERYVHGVSDQYDASAALTSSGSGSQQLWDLALQNTWRFSRAEMVAGLAASSIVLPRGVLFASGKATALQANSDRALSPRAAVRYDLTPNLAVRASAGTGFRAPFLNELLRGYVIGGVSYLPNPNLAPERSASQSAGFDWVQGRNELSLDLTQTFVTDAISFRTVDPTHQIRSNVDRTQTTTTTISYSKRVGECTNVSAWATQQNARVTAGPASTIGKRLPYVPQFSAYAAYDTPLGATRAGLDVSYLGQTFADDLNVEPLGTAVSAGAFLRVPLRDGLQAVIRADNLTNARYLSSVDRYGPPFVLSLSLVVPANVRTAASCPT